MKTKERQEREEQTKTRLFGMNDIDFTAVYYIVERLYLWKRAYFEQAEKNNTYMGMVSDLKDDIQDLKAENKKLRLMNLQRVANPEATPKKQKKHKTGYKHFSQDEKNFIRASQGKLTTTQIAQALGRDNQSISAQRYLMKQRGEWNKIIGETN